MASSRYVVGIDLGTSNCALAYVDTEAAEPRSEVLSVPQICAREVVGDFNTLPSFFYFLAEDEQRDRAFSIDFHSFAKGGSSVIGTYGRDQMGSVSGRVIHSAKSWLCHDGVDRTAQILPWGSEDVPAERRLSPVEVSAAYLSYLRCVWNCVFGTFSEEHRFEKQEIIITVPASFDEAAQRLTLDAARLAGYPPDTMLLEEPQAAFYRWLEKQGGVDRAAPELFSEENTASNTVLVCDMGGGTTDFSLFKIRASSQVDVLPVIERIAVSDHLLLGGDNIDLALAHRLEKSLTGDSGRLRPKQWASLVHQCRVLKERVLSGEMDEAAEAKMSIAGEGSGLISSVVSASISCQEIYEIVLEGFFPACRHDEHPKRRRIGLSEWGLPFAADTAVTKHLAEFLNGREVSAVLFTGGSLKPAFVRHRMLESISRWQGGKAAVELENSEQDLAVAYGAAYSGWIRRGPGRGIEAGYPHSVYLEAKREGEQTRSDLICILPKGTAPGSSYAIEGRRFQLLVDQAVRFQLYTSNKRTENGIGDIVDLDETQFHPLPPIQALLPTGTRRIKNLGDCVEVGLEAEFSELGMLQMYCRECGEEGESRRWQLDFNLRKAECPSVQGEHEEVEGIEVRKEALDRAERFVEFFYGSKKPAGEKRNVKRLVKDLEAIFGKERNSWNAALLRSLWPVIAKGMTRKGRSLAHETSWLYLAGFVLRPGYGTELDSWRVGELWKAYQLGLSFPKESSAQIQWWIMWRRVAGGLDRGQQEKLLEQIFTLLKKRSGDSAELIRLSGSLERVSPEQKRALGDLLVKRILARKSPLRNDCIWALRRICSRVPLYGEANCVIDSGEVVRWYSELSLLDWKQSEYEQLGGLFVQACRLTGDRNRDIAPEIREEVITKLKHSGVASQQVELLRKQKELDIGDQVSLFGEALPLGLRLQVW